MKSKSERKKIWTRLCVSLYVLAVLTYILSGVIAYHHASAKMIEEDEINLTYEVQEDANETEDEGGGETVIPIQWLAVIVMLVVMVFTLFLTFKDEKGKENNSRNEETENRNEKGSGEE